MSIGRKKFLKSRLPLPYLFLAGMLLGIVLVNAGREILLDKTGLLGEEALYHMKYMTIDTKALFWHVVGTRLKDIAIPAVLATTYLGLVVVCARAVWYGAATGIFLAASVMRYGIKGILLAGAGIFPQYILYVPVLFWFLVWCEEMCRGIYFEKSAYLMGRREVIVKILQLVAIVIVVIIGCMLESYVNPILLKKLLKNF